MALDPKWKDLFESYWNSGEWTRPNEALNQLRNNPASFLKKYPILNMFDCSASGPTQAHFANYTDIKGGLRPGSILGTKRMHKTQGFRVQNMQFSNGEGFPFTVQGVFTRQSSGAMLWRVLDNTGPDIMLTAKLTGCTFAVKPGYRPGEVRVIHLQPHQETGLELNRRMKAVNAAETYGRLNYNYESRTINIIGVRSGGKWQIFAQKLDKHRMAIRSLRKLSP